MRLLLKKYARYIKKHKLLAVFIFGLILFAIPWPVQTQYSPNYKPSYCTAEMSSSEYSTCVIGEPMTNYQLPIAKYKTNYFYVSIKLFGFLLMLGVAIIWLVKFLLAIGHKIAVSIAPTK